MVGVHLYTAGVFVAGVVTGEVLTLGYITFAKKIKQHWNKTVSDTDEIGKQTLVEKKDIQESAPKPLEPSKVQVCNTQELNEKYWFFKEGHLPIIKDAQANQDMYAGFYVQCPPDENPDSEFKANLYITGLKDCPCACEIVKNSVLSDIESAQDCRAAAEEGRYLKFPISFEDHEYNVRHFDNEVMEAKKPLNIDTVFKAIPRGKGVSSLHKIQSGNKSEL
jgi:hypothetical protein